MALLDKCNDLMCQLGLSSKKDADAYLLEDKSRSSRNVAKCIKDKAYCTRRSPSSMPNSKINMTRKNANSGQKSSLNRVFKRVYQASLRRDEAPEGTAPAPAPVAAYKPSARQLECVRQVSNWSKITPSNRFNKSRFDAKATDKLIPIASPKLEAMLQNIAALDAEDMVVHGKKFKHFIFSDLKMLGYGAKIISAAFIARGMRPVIKFEKSRIVLDVPTGPGDKFAVLSSTALWESPFKHKLKKEVLDMFNKRPDNVYGETCRFIILDSGFKEGIDLFDVRYVHLFEPLMTEADFTQALGRATRLCGQKGLDFIPNKGWPLDVFKYSQSIPEKLQGALKAKSMFEIALQLKGLDTRLHSISKAIKDVSILSAVDQPLTDEIHKSGLVPRIHFTKGGATVGTLPLSKRRAVESVESVDSVDSVESNKTDKTVGSLPLSKMKSKKSESLKTVRSLPLSKIRKTESLKTVRSLPISVSMKMVKTVTDLSEHLVHTNIDALLDKFEAANSLGRNNPSVKFRLNNKPHLSRFADPLTQYIVDRTNSGDVNSLEAVSDAQTDASDPCGDCLSAAIVPFKPNRLSSKVITPSVMVESNVLVVYEGKKALSAPVPRSFPVSMGRPKSWYDLRRYVVGKFGTMSWPKQQIVNKCIDKPAAAQVLKKDEKDYIVEPKRKTLPQLKLVDYTPTQEFISNYFTVESPIKGMLLWHSVGTGKTCTAIALASTQFEPEGYTIMWVTRHTLKADIWKNVFDFVCHKTIAKEVRDGLLAPEDVEKRQRRLGQQWIPPMSYRQFSNVVQGKNPIYEVLKKRNGKADPLKKTLIIIDEAHKLYSSDFKGAEKPDVPAFMAALQNSYAVSGPESARVLLMTATPYNESPMELMSLLNLCRVKDDHLPTELTKFAEKYMDLTGNFTEDGLLEYMNAVAGQISYLNREADPSQFAQPILHEVVVPISTYDDVNPGDNVELVALQKDAAELEQEKINLEEDVIPHLQTQIELFGPALESKLQECNKLFVGKPKDLKGCLTRVNKTYKDGLKLEERNLREAIKRVDKIGKEFNKLKKKSVYVTKKLKKTGLASLTQQAQLETRCKIGI